MEEKIYSCLHVTKRWSRVKPHNPWCLAPQSTWRFAPRKFWHLSYRFSSHRTTRGTSKSSSLLLADEPTKHMTLCSTQVLTCVLICLTRFSSHRTTRGTSKSSSLLLADEQTDFYLFFLGFYIFVYFNFELKLSRLLQRRWRLKFHLHPSIFFPWILLYYLTYEHWK